MMRRPIVLAALALAVCTCKKTDGAKLAKETDGAKLPACAPAVAGAASSGDAWDLGVDECTGARIDLLRALANPACRSPLAARPPRSVYDASLKLVVTPSALTIAACGRVDIELALINTGGAALPLTFSGEPPGLGLGIKDASGGSPMRPTGTCGAPESIAEKLPFYSKVVLPPGGQARARFSWDAVTRRYGKPLTNAPLGGCEVVRGGPVPKGVYTLHVQISLWAQHPTGPADWAESWPSAHPTIPLRVE
jgi:hypothetical protein